MCRLIWGLALLGVAAIAAWPQELAPAQTLSRELGAVPIPSDTSVNGTVDHSIPSLLASLKHEIRNWLNAKFAFLPADADPVQLQRSLVVDLGRAGLLADSKDHDQHPFGKILGVGISAVLGEPSLLRAVVSYDGYCPPDDSVLFFERKIDQKWHLLLNFDNTDFSNPNGDREVLYAGISPRDDNGQLYAFIVRTRSYCPESGSVWNSINYHVLRPGPDPESPRTVLSAEHGYREDGDCRILLGKNAVTMDFPDSSITASIGRTYVLKYAIGQKTARRIEPVAVSAEGFVEEWMALPWSFAREWSEPATRSSLRVWHERLHTKNGGRPNLLGDLPYRQVCSSDHKLVQISFSADYPTSDLKAGDIFFTVREVGPHLFRLVNIKNESASGCSAPAPDETPGEHLLPESMNRRQERLVQ